MYARDLGERRLTFDFAEGLIKNNLLLVDRETRSVWSQLDAKAVAGPLRDTGLQIVPSIQSTWKFWRQQHPETRVMIREDREGRPYLYSVFTPGEPRSGEQPLNHDASTLGLGLVLGSQAFFFPLSELEQAQTPVEVEWGEERVTVHVAPEGLTAWAKSPNGELVAGVMVYRSGWMDFYPDSQIFAASSE